MKKSRAMSVLGNILFYTIALVVILLLILIGISFFTPAEFPRVSCTMYYSLVGLYNRVDQPILTDWLGIKQLFISFSRIICKPRLIHYGIPGTEWYEKKKWCIDIRIHLTEEGWNYFHEKGYLPESCDKLKEFLENWTNRRKYFLFLANFLVAKNIKIAYEEIGRDYGSLFEIDPILRIVCISYPGKELVNATKFPDKNPDHALFIRIPGEGTNTTIDPDISVKNILNYFKSNPFRKTTGEEYIWATMRDWNYTNIGDYVFRWCPIKYFLEPWSGVEGKWFDCSNSPHARWLANLLDKISVCVLIGVDFWDDPEGDNKNNVIVTKGSIITYPRTLLFYMFYEDPWSHIRRDENYLKKVYKVRIESYGEWKHFFYGGEPYYSLPFKDDIWNFRYKADDGSKSYINLYLNFYTPIPKYLRLYSHLLKDLLLLIYPETTCDDRTYYILNESLTDPNNLSERYYSKLDNNYIRLYFYNESSGKEYNYIPYRSFSECPFLVAPKFFKDVKVPVAGILPNLTIEEVNEEIIEEVCRWDILDKYEPICKAFYKKILGYIVPATNESSPYYIIKLPNNFDTLYFYQNISDFAIESFQVNETYSEYKIYLVNMLDEDQNTLVEYMELRWKNYSVRVPLIMDPHLYIVGNLSSFKDIVHEENYRKLFDIYRELIWYNILYDAKEVKKNNKTVIYFGSPLPDYGDTKELQYMFYIDPYAETIGKIFMLG